MKNILCFGDSNTYGLNPAKGIRYGEHERWCGVLQDILGNNYNIIEEGYNARTINFLDPDDCKICSVNYLPECLMKYNDINLIIIALGLNDFQTSYNSTVDEVLMGYKTIYEIVKKSKFKNTKLLFLASANITAKITCGYFGCLFDITSVKKSEELTQKMEDYIADLGCEFYDLNEIVKTSDIDGLHMDINSHRKIGEKLADIIPQLV